MILALVGNQNCGKTTLFNRLTGANRHVGNFPGVTVDHKIGEVRGIRNCSIVDLPGIYSMRPYSSEEIVTRDFIFKRKPDGIINIVDATNIERNLYLTLQLIDLRIPTVLALNMMDEIKNNNGSIDVKRLSDDLGIPVIPISAAKNDRIDELIQTAENCAKNRILPERKDLYPPGAMHRCVSSVTRIVEPYAKRTGLPPEFCAMKLIEDDDKIIDILGICGNDRKAIENCIIEAEAKCGMDRNAAVADMRYAFIENICGKSVKKCSESKEHKRSRRIDKILTGRYLALPVFAAIMVLIFWLTFGVVGSRLSNLMSCGISYLADMCDRALFAYGANRVVHSLIIDGVFAGVGSVLSFLPIILVLFFFLSMLEDTGYMARVSFVMDKLMRKIGLSGKSVVPMLIGFGCTVPAVMASRTLPSERDRKMTILLTPFISCSAKIPIYAIFCKAFFPQCGALVMSILYFGGILTGIICALIMKNTIFTGEPVPFVMELPNYRLPSLKSVLLLMWEKAKDFLQKAFTVIFVSAIIIWFLQTFDVKMNIVVNNADSLLAEIGRFVSPVFTPLGFGDWRIATSLITGFTAKEAVISTMGVLLNTSISELPEKLGTLFTTSSAASFLTFTLLYTPCVAAVGTIRRELDSRIKTVFVVIFQCTVAWIAAFAVYKISRLFI